MEIACFLFILFYLQVQTSMAAHSWSTEKASFALSDVFRSCNINGEEAKGNTQKFRGNNLVCRGLSEMHTQSQNLGGEPLQGTLAAIDSLFNGQRAMLVNEEDVNGISMRILAVLSEELLNVDSGMEHDDPFPPFSSSSTKNEFSSPKQRKPEIFKAWKNLEEDTGNAMTAGNRSEFQEYSQPLFAMILPLKGQAPKGFMVLLKPFSMQLWLVTGATFAYTTFIIWFMERQSNPEFGGPWQDQLSNVLWFMLSSLLSTQSERLSRNYTRAVVVAWLFVVILLTQSYTTTLNSMLTSPVAMRPDVMDVEWLKSTNATIGWGINSAVRRFLKEALGFKPQNLIAATSRGDILKKFASSSISASFLELHRAKAFLESTNGFTGLGFLNASWVFNRCTPMAADTFYQGIILTVLSNYGLLQKLNGKWFAFPLQDYPISGSSRTENMNLRSFICIFLLSWTISTISPTLFLLRLHRDAIKNLINTTSDRALNKVRGLMRYFE